MCGFIGQVNFKNQHEDFSAELFDLAKLSINRGPDHTGFTKGDNFLLIFNRLSILDLSESGHQPKISQSGRYQMVFNGEIYNHLELREQLKEKINYRGQGDAETLVQLFEYWGIEKTIKAIDGMFAIALMDTLENKCHLIRDFAGIKPLFYGCKNGQLVFASQYDQIVKHSLFKAEAMDAQVLRLYLEQHYLPAPFGIFRNTAQLQPGEWITFSIKGVEKKERYWEFPEYYESTISDNKDALQYLDSLFADSVNAELLSDVPLGSFLSGGIDSPLITYYAQKLLSKPIKTFSIGSDSKIHDESEYAKQYAAQIGSEEHLIRMTADDAMTVWDEAMRSIHEPFADFSILPTYVVSKLAKSKVKVALSGDGGDELFYGYERFGSVTKNYSLMNYPYQLKYLLYGLDKVVYKGKHINSIALFKNSGEAHQSLHSRMPAEWLYRLFPDLANTSLPEGYQTYNYQSKDPQALLQNMRKAEFYGMMQKTLRKVDMASMHTSLEVRVPFLKKTFIEGSLKFCSGLNYGLMHGKEYKKKQLLKDILLKKLPHSPIDNVKRGFTVPLSAWIKDGLSEKFISLSHNSLLENFGMSSKNYDVLINEHLNKGADNKWPLFTVFGLQTWMQ